MIAPPNMLSPRNLERLLGGSDAEDSLSAAQIKGRIIREENVIQRFIKAVRELSSFVIGVSSGDIAFQLAAPLFACDYRIVSPDTIFVNTTQTLPRATLIGLKRSMTASHDGFHSYLNQEMVLTEQLASPRWVE